MLRSETLFGKRDLTPNKANTPASPPAHPASNPSISTVKVTTSGSPVSGGSSEEPAVVARPAPVVDAPESGSKLIVGPNIKLKGVEITDCDTLVVEGRVEATMHSRVIQIAASGAFNGSAEIDIAEIHGEFEGELTVREKLVIYSTGKVSGTIRYGKLVIEEGGQLSGNVQVGTAAPVKNLSVAKSV